ncbi:MAG: RNA-binding protein [Acidaminococcales bacterium]|jgi:predicted RNA-binding protein (virulence factor B family)|nr:RNA-binding protein [Acidaminococcales bacterium]
MNKGGFAPGGEYTLKVARISDLGAFLDAGTGSSSDDILLHKAQQTASVSLGEDVRVSLYRDPKGRLAASMRLPGLKEGEVGLAEVMSMTKHGGFVDIGAERGVFLPFRQMRGRVSVGQKIWVKPYRDKSGRQAVTMLVEDEIRQSAQPAAGAKIGDTAVGRVYNQLDSGWLLFTADKHIAFLHRDERPGAPPAMGEEISGRVTFVRPDGRLNISQKQIKEVAMKTDAQKIEGFLVACGRRMPYGDDTPPEIVREKFGLSKAAFKRALGQLMKQGRARQEKGWTVLVGGGEAANSHDAKGCVDHVFQDKQRA